MADVAQSVSAIKTWRYSLFWDITNLNRVLVNAGDRIQREPFVVQNDKYGPIKWSLELSVERRDSLVGEVNHRGRYLTLSSSSTKDNDISYNLQAQAFDSLGANVSENVCITATLGEGAKVHIAELLYLHMKAAAPANYLRIRISLTVLGTSEDLTKDNASVMRGMECLLDPNDQRAVSFNNALILTDDGEQVPVNRSILAAKSTYFDNLFFGVLKEGGSSTVKMSKITSSTLKDLVKFFYVAVLPSEQEGCIELVKVANMICSDELKDVLEKKLVDAITVENALEYLDLSFRHNLTLLLSASKSFIHRHFVDIVEQPLFAEVITGGFDRLRQQEIEYQAEENEAEEEEDLNSVGGSEELPTDGAPSGDSGHGAIEKPQSGKRRPADNTDLNESPRKSPRK